MTTSNEPVRLNILALPNQQKVIVVMLALVLFGTLLAISSTVPANLFVFLAIVLLFLSFRRVLTRYEAEVQQLGLRQAGSAFAPLEQHLQHLAREYFQMERLPKLAIASKACDLHIVATWRRWYVALDVPQAERMQTMLADPTQHPIVDAILLHELGHLKHSDHIWIEYVRALLEVGTRLMLWFSLLLIGMTILLALINRSFFTVLNPQLLGAIFERYLPGTGDAMIENLFGSVEEFDRVAELARNIDFGQVLLNIIANTLPYLLIGLMLRAIYWQWLMRIREYYADAGAVQVLEDTGPLFGAIGQNAQSLSSSAQRSNLFTSIAQVIKAFIKGLERIYLRSGERAKLLFSPQQLNGPPAS